MASTLKFGTDQNTGFIDLIINDLAQRQGSAIGLFASVSQLAEDSETISLE